MGKDIGPLALAASQATVIYVANLAGEPEETAGYDLGDHIEAVVRHGIDPDVVVSDHCAGYLTLP